MLKWRSPQRSQPAMPTRYLGTWKHARARAAIVLVASIAVAGCIERGENTELIMSDGGTRQCAALGTFVQLADFVVAHDVVTIEYVATTGDAERGPATLRIVDPGSASVHENADVFNTQTATKRVIRDPAPGTWTVELACEHADTESFAWTLAAIGTYTN